MRSLALIHSFTPRHFLRVCVYESKRVCARLSMQVSLYGAPRHMQTQRAEEAVEQNAHLKDERERRYSGQWFVTAAARMGDMPVRFQNQIQGVHVVLVRSEVRTCPPPEIAVESVESPVVNE